MPLVQSLKGRGGICLSVLSCATYSAHIKEQSGVSYVADKEVLKLESKLFVQMERVYM